MAVFFIDCPLDRNFIVSSKDCLLEEAFRILRAFLLLGKQQALLF